MILGFRNFGDLFSLELKHFATKKNLRESQRVPMESPLNLGNKRQTVNL
jgi:hypothetical protein